jgi:hypothetical protein
MAKRIPNPKNKLLRLNNDTRWTMKHNASDMKFAKQLKAMKKKEHEFAKKVYDAEYTPSIIKAMNKLPDEAFQLRPRVDVTVDSKDRDRRIHGILNLEHSAKQYHYYTIRLDDEKHRRLCTALIKYMKKKRALEREIQSYEYKVHTFLRQCKSVRHLLELKPDAYDWFPQAQGCSDITVADMAVEL